MKNLGPKIGQQQLLLTKKSLTILSLLAMFQEGIFYGGEDEKTDFNGECLYDFVWGVG